MTETNEKEHELNLTRDMEDRIHQIILACGVCPLKEKVSLLYLSIDYIFNHNKELAIQFSDEVTLH